MENGKFKVGDWVRIFDENDIAYPYSHFYKVIQIQKNGYRLLSLQGNGVITQKRMKHFLKANPQFKNMKQFIDESYRLVTDTEKVLYGQK